MATVTTEHYRAYTPKPFTRAERETVTILFGGLHWRLEKMLQAVLEHSGYKAQVLPVATKDDLLTGREVADIGQCCPTSFTTGNLVNFLKGESKKIGPAEVSKKYVYLTAGSCGACRFGQYHQSYELGLRNSGLDAFRMFLLAQDNMNQKDVMGDGLDLNLPFTFGALWAIFCTDLVQDLEYQIRPYEVTPGQTDAVVRESIDDLYDVFLHRPRHAGLRSVAWFLLSPYFTKAMRAVRRRFDAIEVDRLRVKPIVKITGEFYLQSYGYPILWTQYFPIDEDLLQWAFGPDLAAGTIRSPFDIKDVWPSSYSSNTNEILWGAKVGARIPWIACVLRLSSYECGMDQPTYTPVQQIVERSGTLFFSFQDLDSTKPAGSVKIRIETITHYLEKYATAIITKKKAAAPPGCPLAST